MIQLLCSWPLHLQIFLALVLAIICGQFTQFRIGTEYIGFYSLFSIPVINIYDFLGQLFLNALKMLIVPLIASAVISGVSQMGTEKDFGRLGFKTIGYYLTTTLIAVLTGLFFVNTIQPGFIDGKPAENLRSLALSPEKVQETIGNRDAGDIVAIFLRMIPTNIVAAGADNREMLGLIIFSLLFGYFMTKLTGESGRVLNQFWQAIYEVMLKITDFVMRFAPIGVFGLVAKVASTTTLKDFSALFYLFITVLLALAVHLLITLPLLLKLLGGINPLKHFRAMFPSLLTAFSTSSSSATTPVTLECIQKNGGVSRRVSSFVIPLGSTVNMDGTALYECVAVMFIAQVYGVTLGLTEQFIIVLLALLTSIGVAGIPSASLVAIVVILGAIGLPAEGIGLLMVFDRLLDMCRTSVNVFSDSCGAVIIARSEGEDTQLT